MESLHISIKGELCNSKQMYLQKHSHQKITEIKASTDQKSQVCFTVHKNYKEERILRSQNSLDLHPLTLLLYLTVNLNSSIRVLSLLNKPVNF